MKVIIWYNADLVKYDKLT